MAVNEHARRLELFISSGCNLHCGFCCESARIADHSFMPWPEVERWVRRAAGDGVRVLQFMGGEATLHPRFVDAARLARELGMNTFVITNALRWEDRGFAEAIAPWLGEVMVSVHAAGPALGAEVTGRASWWARFQPAAANLRATFQGQVRASTVLQRRTVGALDAIADAVLALRPRAWVVGAAVPVPAAREDAITEGLRLAEVRALQPRLRALHARAAAQGCRVVWFCLPHCVLGPELWDDTHDAYVDHQDLSDTASQEVNFWSQAEYHTSPRAVTLARTRPPPCGDCARRDVCGGYFSAYVERHGDSELEPVPR